MYRNVKISESVYNKVLVAVAKNKAKGDRTSVRDFVDRAVLLTLKSNHEKS